MMVLPLLNRNCTMILIILSLIIINLMRNEKDLFFNAIMSFYSLM